METAGVTTGVTVIVIPLLVALGEVAQTAFEVSIQITTSLFAKAEEEYVELFVPTFDPFTFH